MSERSAIWFSTANRKVDGILAGSNDGFGKMQELCDMLREIIPHYSWVGFYLTLPDDRTLVLGPFSGEPTEHTRIGFGTGICGQAAERRETFVVQDVSREENYLSCSLRVRSEIVVPIFRKERVVGEIDIDSHTKEPFTHEDTMFLEELARRVESLIPENFPE